MTLALGAIASPLEIKARWAYSELTSARSGSEYARHELAGIDRLALAGTGFEQLEAAQWHCLASALSNVRGAPHVDAIDLHEAFVLEAWSKGRLCQAQALEHFDPRTNARQPYLDFLHGPRRTFPDGQPELFDPRVYADRVPRDPSDAPSWGAIAIYDFPNVLVDGYLRSVLFMRDAAQDAKLPVWVGLKNPGWRVALR